MSTRTTISYIRFQNSFRLEGYRETLPAGRYKIETEEMSIEGLSFIALRRTKIMLHLQVDKKRTGTTETLVMENPQDLYAALAKDKEANKTAASKALKATFKSIRTAKFDTDALERADDDGMR